VFFDELHGWRLLLPVAGNKRNGRRQRSKEPIKSRFHKSQNPHISKFLELLTDFLIYLMVLWMKFGQFFGICVKLRQFKLYFSKGSNNVQHIECPAWFFYLQFLKWPETFLGFTDFAA
jgi:hypothetical protein